jgi:hypothetical protein
MNEKTEEHEEVKQELETLLELTLQLEHDFNNFVSELDYK